MAAKNDPVLGLNYGWAAGEDDWGTGMDDNLLKLGALTMPVVLGMVTAPTVTTAGARYLVAPSPTGAFAGQAGKVAVLVGTAWNFYTPANGWIAFNLATATPFRYNGTTWVSMVAVTADALAASSATLFATPAGVREFLEQYGITAAFSTAAADLNDVVRGQFFTWSAATTNLPVGSSYGRGFAIASDADNVTQFAVVNGTGAMYIRYKTTGTWGAWAQAGGSSGGAALPFLMYSNPGSTPFPTVAFTAIPFYTKNEDSTGLTMASNTTITAAAAGLYDFEVEVRINGGATGSFPVGTSVGISIDGATTPTTMRMGYSVADAVQTQFILRLNCRERLAANATRKVYLYNWGTGSYTITSAVVKVTRVGS